MSFCIGHLAARLLFIRENLIFYGHLVARMSTSSNGTFLTNVISIGYFIARLSFSSENVIFYSTFSSETVW